MRRTHAFDLYRRSDTPSQDARGRETGGYTKVSSSAVPSILQQTSGRLVRKVQGRDLAVVALLLFHPGALPSTIQITAGDIVVITDGRAPESRYLVVESLGIAERDGRWDDEAMLANTDIDPTDG